MFLLTPAWGSEIPSFEVARHALARSVAIRLGKLRLGDNRPVSRAVRAIDTVPRHTLVPFDQIAHAYEERPLTIGHEPTISDPFIVALMTGVLHVGKRDTVLEIGTGSGYQAAVLGQIVKQVYTIEIVDPLAKQAAKSLDALGYHNISVRTGDGYRGWPAHAPFDAIIVTAGACCVPPVLMAQLKTGGRMVIPLGRNWADEVLIVLKKHRNNRLAGRSLGPVMFVDFTGVIKGSSRLSSYVDDRHKLAQLLRLCDV